MGVYYRWRCDGTQEYFDPGMLLGPKCPPGGGYGIKAGSIPYSAWVVGALATEHWSGCEIVLVGDGDDAYDCVGYADVSQYVLRNLLHKAPDDGWWGDLATAEHVCDSYDRNVWVSGDGGMQLCCDARWPGAPWREPGDLGRFWEGAGQQRCAMATCNRLCGISHSLRNTSSTMGAKLGVKLHGR